jgi:HK97 family phage portal protein
MRLFNYDITLKHQKKYDLETAYQILTEKARSFTPSTYNPYRDLQAMHIAWNDLTASGPTVNQVNAYLQSAGVYSVINRIAKTAAIAQFKVYKVKNKKAHRQIMGWKSQGATKESLIKAAFMQNVAYEEQNNHPFQLLLDKPNPYQGGQKFTIACIAYHLLNGERFLKLGQIANLPTVFSLYNLPPSHMRVFPDPNDMYGVTGYELWLGGKPTKFSTDEIIHSKYFNPNVDSSGSHLRGLSPLVPASKNIKRAELGIDRSNFMLENGGAGGLVYAKPTGFDMVSPEQASIIKQALNESINGIGNKGSIQVANGDFGYHHFGLDAHEMTIADLEKFSLQQICNIYNAPYTLFSAENSTYNNIIEAKKELITMCCVPELVALRDDFNEIARISSGRQEGDTADIYIDFDTTPMPELQDDMEKMAKIMDRSWWFKGNEKRLAMNWDEDTEEPMMNKYLVPTGLIELSQLDPAIIEQQMERQMAREDDVAERDAELHGNTDTSTTINNEPNPSR